MTAHDSTALLRMQGISKSFPGVKALESVDFEVGRAEIHAFLGENGAGKSTLLKILSGAQPPDTGTITFDGRQVAFASPQEAQAAGIVTIYQEFTLAPDMTVAENVFIGREPGSRLFISYRKLEEQTAALCRRIGLDRSPTALVRDLSVAEQQMVEIARALSMKSKLIVMDEPTSALSRAEVEKLFAIIRSLKAEGITTIFVTHRLEEVFEICDSYTVLRDGRHVGRGKVSETSMDGIIRLMVGRELGLLAERDQSFTTAEVALEVKNLTRKRKSTDASAIEIHDVSFRVNKGEILGIAGLVGAGRTETARAIFGADLFDSGEVLVEGKPSKSPRRAMPSPTASAWCRKTASSRRCFWARPSAPTSRLPRMTASQPWGFSSAAGRRMRWSRNTASSSTSAWPHPIRSSATCRAATSRRSCLPAGWRSAPRC